MQRVNRPPRPAGGQPLRRTDPESLAPIAQGRRSRELPMAVEEIDARDVEDVDETAWQRPTDARRQRIEENVGPVSYGPPPPSLRKLLDGFARWGRQYWYVLALMGATTGSVALNRLWEIMGLATKADLDRTRIELRTELDAGLSLALDGGAHDSKAREALDGGANDTTARASDAEIEAKVQSLRSEVATARRLIGVDAGLLELDAGTTVKPRP